MKNTLERLQNIPKQFQSMNIKTKTLTGGATLIFLPVLLVTAGLMLIGLGLSLPFLFMKKGTNKRIFRSFHFQFPKQEKSSSNGMNKINGHRL